jgi:hypothetical protein
MTNKEYRPRLSESQYRRHLEMESWNNVLVIGDLHAPFTLDGYLEHCIEQRERFACNKIVFIGDLIDNHYSSYHETSPDGYGAGEELDRAIDRLKPWYESFPDAKVTLGNHDMIIMRKAFSSGLSKRWIKGLAEVLETPGWDFVEQVEYDNVIYTHGTGSSGEYAAYTRAIHRRKSHVMGHLHTAANVVWSASDKDKIFGMQVGCGLDEKAYAFEYGRTFRKKMVIACGVVLNNGQLPIVIPMDL